MEEQALYTCTTLERTVPLSEFRRDLVDVPRFSGCCRDCPNWGRYWSCPPFSFDPMAIWERYASLRLYARKLVFRKDRLFPGERRAFEEKELPKIKGDMARELLAMEAEAPGSLALFPGKCEWCSVCARIEGRPCRTPDRMRYSIEALGGDCGGALERYMGESLRWAEGRRLPEQMILLGGLLLPKEE
ncbi:MAG: hypothetical protein IJQ45_07295 [Clostridia bacterium]|nr:hypothetical protein [Clostridia bacterium]